MIPRTKLIPFLLLVVLLLLQLKPLPIYAQDLIPANAFLIRNRSKEMVTFWLRRGSEEWVKEILDVEERETFFDKDQIYMSPPGHEPIHRSLRLGKRYRIVCNGSSWNIEPMEL